MLKPGSRWKSAVCTAEVVVVRPVKEDLVLECGGHPMTGPDEEARSEELKEGLDAGVSVGKRYIDTETGLEVLGAKPGKGTLAVNGRPLNLKEAKALPASD